ncbi:aromatic ring-hydroxylating oxygenase subunit alpha [Sphingosinithalassobacter portus]|uniref:aromatic ring-hydroxylating oxygenase subunit alpha n=1 Tax=Stakelama portus TaxID=2676234 RepID=UPI000D6DCE01|nr:aromatic ring-hydroxylating dioxygenase subunit alpha [Sphingosinithalassobacter portus]
MNVATAARPREKNVPLLASLSTSQQEAIARIPPHAEADASAPAIDERRPSNIFIDQARFDLEWEHVFRALPIPVTLSALVAEPGSLIAVESYGVPIIVTRARDGEVRAFLNACTHKGSKLVEDCEPHAASRVTCPYHAWTYGLDGKLIGVPRAETIANFDKGDRPLAQLPCREAGGIVYVGLDRKRDYDFSMVEGQLAEDFEALNIPRAHVYGRKMFDLKANWKLVLEPFLEGYHVQRLHAASVGPMFADSPTITDRLGPHFRQTSGKINFDPAKLDPNENIHKAVTFAYELMPNAVVITSPYYISVMILAPRGPDRTMVDYMMLTREAPDNPKAEELFAKSYNMVLGVFGGEDFRAAELSQAGLSTGAMDDVLYVGLEDKIPAFYETLESHFPS